MLAEFIFAKKILKLMHITYKVATYEDIKKIREIAQKTWFVTYEPIIGVEQSKFMFELIYSEDGLTEQMEFEQIFILQNLDNQPIAFAAYSIKDFEISIYKLNKLYLNPDFHGSGFGKKLIEDIELRVKGFGGKYLDLNVNKFNKARFFYEKLGFEIIEEVDIPIGEYWMNDFVMRKVLV